MATLAWAKRSRCSRNRTRSVTSAVVMIGGQAEGIGEHGRPLAVNRMIRRALSVAGTGVAIAVGEALTAETWGGLNFEAGVMVVGRAHVWAAARRTTESRSGDTRRGRRR